MNEHEEYVELARSLIKNLEPGDYRLGQIFGELWPAIPKHNKLGTYFKAEVKAGHVEGVEWLARGTDNNQRYRVG